jgi:hypothetical protein
LRTSLSDLVQPGSPVGASADPALGYEEKPERKLPHPRNAAERNLPDALPLRNATSHADPHSHGCPSAPAVQHFGGADVAVALQR